MGHSPIAVMCRADDLRRRASFRRCAVARLVFPPRLFADEVVGLATPLTLRRRGELRKPHAGHWILYHVLPEVVLVLVEREVRLDERDDPVIDPIPNRLSVDRIERPLGLAVRLELHEGGE